MNDNGDLAFMYELANGTIGIAVARIVPEPSSAMLLAVGLLGVWKLKWKLKMSRHVWKHASS